MNSLEVALVNKIIVFVLILVRMSTLFVITPVFGRRELPAYLKIGFAFFCSIILLPLVGDVKVDYSNVFSFSLLIVKEMLVGIILGYVSFMFFSALYIAGQIMDMQVGFGMVNVIDPMMGSQVPMIGNYIYILTTLFFLMMDGHHILLATLFKSYTIVPINGFFFGEALVQNIISIFVNVFIIGFQISIPVLAAALLAEVALGILAKTVPQMNVFVVGMPLKIGIGLITLYLMMPVFFKIMDSTFDKMYNAMFMILKTMVKG